MKRKILIAATLLALVLTGQSLAGGPSKVVSIIIATLDDLGITTNGVYLGGLSGPGSSTDGGVAVWSGTGGDTLASSDTIIDSYGVTLGTGSVAVLTSAGDPEGVISAPAGSLFLRSDGSTDTSIYRKESGDATSAYGWLPVTAGGAGGFSISFPPSAGVASISSTTYPAYISIGTSGAPALEFDGVTMEAIEFWNWTLPNSYDSASNLTVEIVILCDSTTSQGTAWDVRFGTIEAADLDSTAPGSILDTAVEATGTTSGTQGTATTIQWTLSNSQIDDAAAGDLMVFQLYRDGGDADDTSIVDVQVLAIRCYQ